MNTFNIETLRSPATVGSGMRVVVIESSADIRGRLRSLLDDAHEFIVTGLADSWPEGVRLIEEFVPELLIARRDLVPAGVLARLSSSTFPIVIELGVHADASPGSLDSISLPLDNRAAVKVLDRARAEIYTRKAAELSRLLHCYMTADYDPRRYLATLKVDDNGLAKEIRSEEVMCISADGNYVRIHTQAQTYEMRETMTGLSEKLDPRNFVRVHRSFIVNLRYVRDVVDKGAACSVIVLHDGTDVPVGPNYRDDIGENLTRKLRLSA